MEETILQLAKSIVKINDEMGQLQIDVAVLKVQVDSILWILKALFAAFIGIAFTQILQIWKLFLIHRDNRK